MKSFWRSASLFIITIFCLAGADKVYAHGLMIHAAEVGVAKFHRADAQAHPGAYNVQNAWTPYVMPANATNQTPTPITFQNPDGSFSVIFSSLEELLQTAVQLSQQTGQKIEVLNLNGHGLPGAMWFPTTRAMLHSRECASWRYAAYNSDKINYDQYYSPIAKDEIMDIRASANEPPPSGECLTGAQGWRAVAQTIPNLQSYFTDNAQVHFESCVVGYGPAGEQFTETIGALLLSGSKHGMVKTLMNFGLGDWSMPEGMGFFDYINDQQLDQANSVYPVNRRDRDIMIKGAIRVATHAAGSSSRWSSSIVADQDFMLIGFASPGFSNSRARIYKNDGSPLMPMGRRPTRIRIPGTKVYLDLTHRY